MDPGIVAAALLCQRWVVLSRLKYCSAHSIGQWRCRIVGLCDIRMGFGLPAFWLLIAKEEKS